MAIKFDPTIKYGDLLTLGAMLVTVTIAFSVLDKRISVLEERSVNTTITATEKQNEQKETLKGIKEDIKDLQRSVNELGRVIASKPTVRIP